jgi:peptidoglycan/LPS O-acetylase OafA/YrhL
LAGWPAERWAGWSAQLITELLMPLANVAWLHMLTQAPLARSSRALRAWPLRWLGRVSFAVYCLHWPTMEYYCWARTGALWMVDRLEAAKMLRPWEGPLLVAPLVLLVSWAGTSVEARCQAWLHERLTKLVATRSECEMR